MNKNRNTFNRARREFFTKTGLTAGAATLGLAVNQAAHAANPTKLLVYIFLRGGQDGLSYVVPRSGAGGATDFGHYMSARPGIFINEATSINLNGAFGFNPFCNGFAQLFSEGDLALVHAAGHPPGTETRSHFDAQEQIELGTPGEQSINLGWLARHLNSITTEPDAIFTAMVSSSNPPISLAGYPDVATLDSPSSFSPNTGTYGESQRRLLRQLYSGAGSLDLAGQATLDAVDLVDQFVNQTYNPPPGVNYPNNNSLADDLELIAQLYKQNLGIEVATVDRGGWDTHTSQNALNANAGFGRNIREVSEAVTAFYRDMQASGRANDVTIVIQSEFGRQVSENANAGTDHGLGNPITIIGGQVIGGFFGGFPGLASNQRAGDGVNPTTDFRRVLATVTDRLMDNNNIDLVFPDFASSYVPMGFAPP